MLSWLSLKRRELPPPLKRDTAIALAILGAKPEPGSFGARCERRAMQNLTSFDGPERRRKTRFPIELGARYAAQVQQEIEGERQTVNISSRGVLMRSTHDLFPDASVSVVIEWPIPIDNASPLALHIHGTVVRSEPGLVAVQF